MTVHQYTGKRLTISQGTDNFNALKRMVDIAVPVTEYGVTAAGFQSAIDAMEDLGGGIVDVPAATYTFTTEVFARSNVCIRCAPGVTFIKDFYNNSNEAIFCNEVFSTPVNNFSILGWPTLSTTSQGGKLLFLLGDYLRLFVTFGTWYNGAGGDGFAVAIAGEGVHIDAYGGDPQEGPGVDGVHFIGGSGNVRLTNVKSGDDTLGLFPLQPAAGILGDLDIHDVYAELVNCESTHARLAAIGIPTDAAWATQSSNVRNCHVNVIGGRAFSVGQNAATQGAVMIYGHSSTSNSQVRNNIITARGVDCGGQYALRMFDCEDCEIQSLYAVNADLTGFVVAETDRCTVVFKGDQSTATSGEDIGTINGTNTDLTLDIDCEAPPGSGTLLTIGSNGSNPVTRAKVKMKVRELQTSQTMVAVGAGGTDVTFDWVEGQIAAGATSTIGVSIASGATRTTIRGGDLRAVASSLINGATTTRMDRDNVRTTIAQKYTAVAGVADFTFYRFANGSRVNLTGTLTADRTITMDTTQLVDGDEVEFWRSGGDTGGPWTWTIGSTTLAQNTGCKFVWNASGAAWVRMG